MISRRHITVFALITLGSVSGLWFLQSDILLSKRSENVQSSVDKNEDEPIVNSADELGIIVNNTSTTSYFVLSGEQLDITVSTDVSNPQTVSDLMSVAEQPDQINRSMVIDQLMTSASACKQLNAAADKPISRLNEWVRTRLKEFCDVDLDSVENMVDKLFENSGVYSTMEIVKDEDMFGTPRSSSERMLRVIADATSELEMRTALVQLIELHFQDNTELELVDLSGYFQNEAIQAAYDASIIFMCRSFGGCGSTHIKTLHFCAIFGCGDSVTDIENAIYQSRSPRHFSLVNRLLYVIYRARSSFS